jgi:hypothetical protein
MDSKSASADIYQKQGMGQRIGFGERPAVLVIDMQHDFCDPAARRDVRVPQPLSVEELVQYRLLKD